MIYDTLIVGGATVEAGCAMAGIWLAHGYRRRLIRSDAAFERLSEKTLELADAYDKYRKLSGAQFLAERARRLNLLARLAPTGRLRPDERREWGRWMRQRQLAARATTETDQPKVMEGNGA